jgi:hypothetical protein
MPSRYSRKTTRSPYGPAFNYGEAATARRRDDAEEAARLALRGPFDRAAEAVADAERLLKRAFDSLPPEARDLRRDLLLSAVASTGLVQTLRRAADRVAP